jgi:hypothetical protein
MNPSVTENDLSVTEHRDRGRDTLARAPGTYVPLSRLSRVTVTQRGVTKHRDSDEPSGPVTAKAQVDRWEGEGGLTDADQRVRRVLIRQPSRDFLPLGDEFPDTEPGPAACYVDETMGGDTVCSPEVKSQPRETAIARRCWVGSAILLAAFFVGYFGWHVLAWAGVVR